MNLITILAPKKTSTDVKIRLKIPGPRFALLGKRRLVKTIKHRTPINTMARL
jgi:hypothetical protein